MRLAIIGAGGHSKVAANIAHLSGWREISHFDQNKKLFRQNVNGNQILGDIETFLEIKDDFDGVFVAIGDNFARHQKINLLKTYNVRLINLVHPSAIIEAGSILGAGCIFVAGCVVNPNCIINDGVIINTNSCIDHDCVIGAFAHIAPGAVLAGSVVIGEDTHVGMSSSIVENINVGCQVHIAAGAVVTCDIGDFQKVKGIPARNY